jgi:Tfp pilus assembly protein PilF
MIALAVLLCAACASEPTSGPGAPASPQRPAAPTAAPSPPPEPVAPTPAEPTRESRAEAQRIALQAVDQLQNGDEPAARATLDRALAMDPANELAKRLVDQIRADAQRELGATFFRYTVQPDDSLSKLAQRFLGDRFRFYILAKYNDITNPSRLHTGQVIKIPGREPPPVAAPARPPEVAKPAEPVEPPKPPEPKVSEAEQLYKQALAQQKAGDLDGAYASLQNATKREPSNATYTKQLELTRVDLVRRYDRAATQAFQRQNLDLAITNWNKVLEIDPNNQKARLERARAEDLKKRMQEKFGNKQQ